MRIVKENTVATIIDIQEKLFPVMEAKEDLLSNVQVLLEGLKILNIPVVFTQQYTKGLGDTVYAITEEIENFQHIEKKTFSCCDEKAFSDKLAALNRQNVIITGIETHVCILQTAIDLLAKAYQPIIVEDCTSSRSLNDKNIAIERLRQEGAIITTTESILFELTRISGNQDFKDISQLIK